MLSSSPHQQCPGTTYWRFAFRKRNDTSYLHLLELSPHDSGPTVLAKLRSEYNRVTAANPASFCTNTRVFWDPIIEVARLSEVRACLPAPLEYQVPANTIHSTALPIWRRRGVVVSSWLRREDAIPSSPPPFATPMSCRGLRTLCKEIGDSPLALYRRRCGRVDRLFLSGRS